MPECASARANGATAKNECGVSSAKWAHNLLMGRELRQNRSALSPFSEDDDPHVGVVAGRVRLREQDKSEDKAHAFV